MSKIRDLIHQNDEKRLVLPDFQRDLEWNHEKQKSLLASFLVNLPIGSLLLLKGKKDSFAAREIGVPNTRIEPYTDCLYLLDGQQRLTTLKSAFTDFFKDAEDWQSRLRSLYSPLKVRWFIKVKPSQGQEDVFGFKTLKPNNLNKYEPSDVLDNIIHKRVHITKPGEYHNPGFTPQDENGNPLKENQKTLKIAQCCAEDHLVPLYSVFGGNENSLYAKTIHYISLERAKYLRAEIADIDNDDERKKTLIDILSPVESSIAEYIDNEEGNTKEIEAAWSLLTSNWSISLRKQLEAILDYEIKLIELPLSEIARAVSIFTSINEGGQKLDNYDLIVAKAAKDSTKESLTKRICQQVTANTNLSEKIVGPPYSDEKTWDPSSMHLFEESKICKDFKDQYLNLLSIYSHTNYGDVSEIKLEHIKAKKHLALTHTQINENTFNVVNALVKAYEFLQYRCGIFWVEKMPYKLMIIPIAYLMFRDETIDKKSDLDKIEYWYWSSLFGGYYREGQNERCISDLQNLYTWIVQDSENPFSTRFDSIFTGSKYSDKETLLLQSDQSPGQAIINGMQQYIVSTEPRDFLPRNYEVVKIRAWEVSRKERITLTHTEDENTYSDQYDLCTELHHVIPLNTATSLGQSTKEIRSQPKHILNSPLNLTTISSKANSILSDLTPDKYLELIANHAFDRHFLPSAEALRRREGESDDKYYERVLSDRFHQIKQAIANELDNLVR